MKRLALVFAALIILVATGLAQSGTFITANVPFPFHVGDNYVPAGDCRVAYYGTGDILILTNAKAQETLAVKSLWIRQGDPDITPKFLFHKYGNTYFLTGVGMPHQKMHAVPRSKTEREFLTKAAPEEVTVVARLVK